VGRHDDPLAALDEVHEDVRLGLEPLRVAREDLLLELAPGDVEASEIALRMVEGRERVRAAFVAHLQRDMPAGEEVAQRREREGVARVDAQRAAGIRRRALELRLDLRGHALQERREAGGDTLLRPQQLVAQRRELRAAPAAAEGDGRPERLPCALQEAPRVPVRIARALAGGRERARLVDAREEG
jgi:hypothetical protein